MTPSLTLDQVVSAAVAKTGEDAGLEVAPPTAEAEPVVVVEEPKEPAAAKPEPPADSLALSDDELVQAKQLFTSLKDPAKSKVVIEFLAGQNGFVKGETQPTTQKEVKAAKVAITDQLKEALGPDLSYIAEKMGPIIQKVLEEQIEEGVKPIREQASREQIEKLNTQGMDALDKLGTEYFGGPIPANLQTVMAKLIEERPPQPGQKMLDYSRDTLAIAASREGVTLTKHKANAVPVIPKKVASPASRLASEARGITVGETASPSPTTQMTLNDAIQDAIKQTNAAAN